MEMKFIPSRGALKARAQQDGSVTIAGYGNKKVIDSIGDLMYTGEENVDLTRFNKNPIMFFNHDRDQPVGRWTKVELRPEGLWLEGKLSASDVPEIRKIRDLVREGILNSLSIGYDEIQSSADVHGVNHVTKWKLNEVSIVSIPCNEDSVFDLGKAKAVGSRITKTKTFDEARDIMGIENQPTEPTVATEPTEPTEPTEKKEDEKTKEGKDFQECVSAKIPKLIEEGKTQEEAVAIAMSMCSDENDKCGFSPEHLKAALELARELHATKAMGEDNTDEEKTDEEKPDEEKPEEDEEEKEDDEKGLTTPLPKVDDTDFGNPHLELMKSQLAMLGQISTQVSEMLSVMERLSMLAIRGENTDNGNDTQPDMESQETEPQSYTANEVAELLNIARQVKDITSQYIK